MTDLISQRERIMDQVDQWLDEWPDRKSSAYTENMTTAASQMLSVVKAMRTQGTNELEIARALRYLGSIYFDLEPSGGVLMLTSAEHAFETAVSLFQKIPDETEQAKLNFAWANCMRLLYKDDPDKLREALVKA